MSSNTKRILRIVGAILLFIGVALQINATNILVAFTSFVFGMIVTSFEVKPPRKSDDA